MHRFLAASLLLLCPIAQAQNSATFRADPAHTGVYAAPGTAALHKVKWQFHTRAQVLSSPAVAGNTVYFGSNDGNLYAVNAETGDSIWAYQTGGQVISSPALTRNLVYVGSMAGVVVAVDRSSGQLQWQSRTDAGVYSSPAVVDETIYVGCEDGRLYALRVQ